MTFDIHQYLSKKKPIPGEGPSSAKLMIIADHPTEYDDQKQGLFHGPRATLLDEMLRKAGTTLSQTYRATIYRKRPPDNLLRYIPKEDLAKDKEHLWSVIRTLKPNCILVLTDSRVGLGLTALTGKKGLTQYRGSILPSTDGIPKVVATIDPLALATYKIGYEAKSYIQLDINRAVQESKTKELNLPERTLDVARNSEDVRRFIDGYRSKPRRISVDIEVRHCIPDCVSIAFDCWHAISIPLFNPRGCPAFIPEYQYPEIYQLLYDLFQECEVIGQNFKFDAEKLDKMGLFTPKFYADTMLMANLIHSELPQSLGFLTSIYTREPFYKHELKDSFDENDYRKRFIYNAKDSAVTYEVYNSLIKELIDAGYDKFYFEFQHKLHDLYRELERTGIKVDRGIQRELWEQYSEHEDRLQRELNVLVGYDINIARLTEVRRLLYEELKFPKRYTKKGSVGATSEVGESGPKTLATDEETLVGLYGNHADSELKKRIIDTILELRGVKKSKSTYICCEPDFDGRMRFQYKIV